MSNEEAIRAARRAERHQREELRRTRLEATRELWGYFDPPGYVHDSFVRAPLGHPWRMLVPSDGRSEDQTCPRCDGTCRGPAERENLCRLCNGSGAVMSLET